MNPKNTEVGIYSETEWFDYFYSFMSLTYNAGYFVHLCKPLTVCVCA